MIEDYPFSFVLITRCYEGVGWGGVPFNSSGRSLSCLRLSGHEFQVQIQRYNQANVLFLYSFFSSFFISFMFMFPLASFSGVLFSLASFSS